MKVAWLTARVLGYDLCETTQIKLANGLSSLGIELRLYSPGTITNQQFEHIPIQRSKVKGLQTYSVQKGIEAHLEAINQSDFVLIDWRLSGMINKIVPKYGLVDRGPPADKGIFSRFQWKSWSRGWRIAKRGFVVSKAHKSFVENKIPKKDRTITILEAGVDTDLFGVSKRMGPIKMVYHGRVDNHRGLQNIIQIMSILDSNNADFKLFIHGDGNLLARLKKLKSDNIEVTDKLSHDEIANRLASYDIGLLPMPSDQIWSLASPLKRSEYLGAGLVLLGIDHSGHRLEHDYEFVNLFNETAFIPSAVSWLMELDRERLSEAQHLARTFAEENLDWRHSVEKLFEMISS